MAATIPECYAEDAAGTTTADYADWLHDKLAAAGEASFSVVNAEGGATATSWTLRHSDGWDANFRLSAGKLLGAIDPTGGLASSSSPVFSPQAQPELELLPVVTGTAARALLAIYSDAILLGLKNSSNDAFPIAFHLGSIMAVRDPADPARGLDGLGTLAHVPQDQTSSTLTHWFSQGSLPESSIRLADQVWGPPILTRSPNSISDATANSRFSRLSIAADEAAPSNASTSPERGTLKYLFADAELSTAVRSVIPSVGTDQAMLAIQSDNAVTRLRALWNKTVTP